MSYRQYLDNTKLIIENPLAQKHFHLLMGMMNSEMINIKTNWITKLIGEKGREKYCLVQAPLKFQWERQTQNFK